MAALQEVCGQPEADQLDALAALSGDEDAFVRLILRHESAIRRLLARFSNDRGVFQDLCQENYLEAFRSLSIYRYQGSFAGWFWRISLLFLVGFQVVS